MEWAQDAWVWFIQEVAAFGLRWLVVGVLAMLGVLLFGRNYKRRIAALEARASMPAINNIINFNTGTYAHDHDRQLREAIEAKTTQNLKETIRRLPQLPLGDGHSYARLPNGTNIVTMADETIRLAIPKPLSATASFGPMKASLTLRKRPASTEEET